MPPFAWVREPARHPVRSWPEMRTKSIAGWTALAVAAGLAVFLLMHRDDSGPSVPPPKTTEARESGPRPERRSGDASRAGPERRPQETVDEAATADESAKQPTGRIEGRVLDESASPIEGAEIWLCPLDAPGVEILPDFDEISTPVATSAGDGRFAVATARAGHCMLSSTHPLFVTATIPEVVVMEGQAACADLRMQRGLSIAGRVVRDPGVPVGAVSIRIAPADDSPDLPLPVGRDITPDAEGRFRVDCLRATRYSLVLGGGFDAECEPVVAQAGDLDVVLHIRLAGTKSLGSLEISGTVQLADGQGVGGAWVRAVRLTGTQRQHFGGMNSNSDGSFTIGPLPPGKYYLRVRGVEDGPNLQTVTVADVAAGSKDVLIVVQRGLVVAGHVRLPDGTPVKSAQVAVEYDGIDPLGYGRAEYGSVTDGSFVVGGLSPGPVRVTVTVDRYLPCTITAQAGAEGLLLELVASGAIRGCVQLPDGKPAPRAWVRIVEPGGDLDAVGGARADAEGRFELRDVALAITALSRTPTTARAASASGARRWRSA